jgi:tyrosinase
MRTEVVLNGSSAPSANYIGWSPRPATIRLSDATGANGPVVVTLRNQRTNVGGQVVFSTSTQTPGATLQLPLPVNGSPVDFFVAGKFRSASETDRDAVIEVVDGAGAVLSQTSLMVRVRKDVTTLTAAERDLFIDTLARFNASGMGKFADVRAMHVSAALDESHGSGPPPPQFPNAPAFRDAFLPWHRAYLLDLERALQAIEPAVALHYWRFDKSAPQLFSPDFLGEPRTGSSVRFSSTNPLRNWKVDSQVGFQRDPRFNHLTSGASNANGPVLTEAQTFKLGTTYRAFVRMEGQPHGRAHTCFDGPINNPATAPRDPLFFLLHCNVDRLWAQWQFLNRLWNPTVAGTYTFLGKDGDPGATRVGHNLLDTMWPWNGIHASPRPTTPPPSTSAGPGMLPSSIAGAPRAQPTVEEMLDYQGQTRPGVWQGFDYDDVMF